MKHFCTSDIFNYKRETETLFTAPKKKIIFLIFNLCKTTAKVCTAYYKFINNNVQKICFSQPVMWSMECMNWETVLTDKIPVLVTPLLI